MSEQEELDQSKSGSLMSHLVELRDRVVRMVLAVLPTTSIFTSPSR